MSTATSSTNNWSSRVFKDQLRQWVAAETHAGIVSSIMFPADTGYDIIQHRLLGKYTDTTHIYAVEDDRATIEALKKNAERVFPPGTRLPTYHYGKLSNLEIIHFIDHCWFDLCGNLQYDDVSWFQRNNRYLCGALSDIFFTFSVTPRNSSFIWNVGLTLFKKHQRFFANQMSALSGCAYYEKVGLDGSVSKESMTAKQLANLVTRIIALKYVFSDYDFNVKVRVYADRTAGNEKLGTSMFLVRLYNLRPPVHCAEEPRETLLHIFHDVDELMVSRPKTTGRCHQIDTDGLED